MRYLSSYCVGVFAAIAITCSALPSSADIAPPPGYVEQCTLSKQKAAGDECLDCQAYHGNFEHCSNMLSEYGFAGRCKTRGASVWREVWCRPDAKSAVKVPPDVLALLSSPASPEAMAKNKSKRDPKPAPSVNQGDDPLDGLGAPTASASASAAPTPSEAPESAPAPTPGVAPQPEPVAPATGGCLCVAVGGADSARALPITFAAAALALFFTRRRWR